MSQQPGLVWNGQNWMFGALLFIYPPLRYPVISASLSEIGSIQCESTRPFEVVCIEVEHVTGFSIFV